MNLESLACPACGLPVQDMPSSHGVFRCPACGTLLVRQHVDEDKPVSCQNCQAPNDRTRRYCEQCGASLQVGCPFCYALNPVDVGICGNCGAKVRQANWHRNFWEEEKRRYDEERWARLKQAEAESEKAELNRLLRELEEPENHALTIFSLQQLGNKAVERLIEALRTSDDPDARFGAAHALGKIGDPRAVEALMAALQDPEPAVRYWAVEALSQMDIKSAAGEIGNLLSDDHKGVRELAEKVLEGWGMGEGLRKKRTWWG